MATQSVVVAGRNFAEISNYDRVIEEMHHESCEGRAKRPRSHGRFNESYSDSQFKSSSSYVRYSLSLYFYPQSQPSRLV